MSDFVTCLNCMDGRTQKPLIEWLEQNHNAGYVDMITEAGMDGYIANNSELAAGLRAKIDISIKKHGSNRIFVVGHHDCGGHPVDEATHREHIIEAVKKIRTVYSGCRVTGLWVSDKWQVEIVSEKNSPNH